MCMCSCPGELIFSVTESLILTTLSAENWRKGGIYSSGIRTALILCHYFTSKMVSKKERCVFRQAVKVLLPLRPTAVLDRVYIVSFNRDGLLVLYETDVLVIFTLISRLLRADLALFTLNISESSPFLGGHQCPSFDRFQLCLCYDHGRVMFDRDI